MVLKHSADQVILQFWIAMNVQLSSCLPFILHFTGKLLIPPQTASISFWHPETICQDSQWRNCTPKIILIKALSSLVKLYGRAAADWDAQSRVVLKHSSPLDTFLITNRLQSSQQELVLKVAFIGINVPLETIQAKVSSSVLQGGTMLSGHKKGMIPVIFNSESCSTSLSSAFRQAQMEIYLV